jgi:beta-glucosidase/6-phospho-beta-glucosidase/beta-galactosidase
LLILDYGNALHTPYGYPSNDTEIQAFVSYANWVSVQMAGKVDYYEIWNEWLQATGVCKRKPTSDPTIYTNLVKYTYKAIKKMIPVLKF